jgi:tryptophanyl-tRNA synthetase
VAKRKRVLSGMRPTGRLHIGHYFGALQNWLKLQAQLDEYECFFFIADWHALTTHYAEDTQALAENTFQVAVDWLSVGLDPAKSIIFVQSQLLEHAELHLLLSMVTPLSWLERVPTYKEQIEQLKDKDLGTYGFLGYPLLQAADIVMYGDPRADLLVPVGEDQVPHIELTREIVRRFNANFGFRMHEEFQRDETAVQSIADLLPKLGGAPFEEFTDVYRRSISGYAAEIGVGNFLKKAGKHKKYFSFKPVLREPAAMLTETPRLPGLDGRRMAKSYNNAVWLSEDDDSIRAKVKNMMTDPQRVRRQDPGRPEVCPVFAYHKLFSTPETIAWSDSGCRTAGIGCIECKAAMADHLIRWIEPIRARRREYEADPERVSEILRAGSKKAQKVARKTMRRVREAIFGTAKPAGTAESAPAKQAAMGN